MYATFTTSAKETIKIIWKHQKT